MTIVRHATSTFVGIAISGILSAQIHGGAGRGDASSGSQLFPTMASAYRGGLGRGDAFGRCDLEPGNSIAYQGGNGRGDGWAGQVQALVVSSVYRGGQGRGDVMATFNLPVDALIWVRAYLEGPFDGFAGMHDSLRVQQLIPLTEPYSGLGFPGGGESIDPSVLGELGNGVVVDWVHVQLRSADDPSTVTFARNGLVLTNGFIVDTDGVSPLQFSDLIPGSYHVAVLHRNHMGCMTLNGVPVTSTPNYVDFTLPYTLTHGMEARKSMGIAQVLWAGDVNQDGALRYTGQNNDRDPILFSIGGSVPTNTTIGYLVEDINLDGVVKYSGQNNDRDPILQNIGGSVPTNVRQGQLP